MAKTLLDVVNRAQEGGASVVQATLTVEGTDTQNRKGVRPCLRK